MKKRFRITALILTCCIVFLTGCAGGGAKKTVVVGAKNYTEQDILGNLLSALLKNNTNLDVQYKHEMSSNVIFSAIQSGDVDLYIDYTGTIYGNYLNYSDMKSADEVYQICLQEMADKYGIQVLNPLGFNNTYCLAVRPDTAEAFSLQTFSDLAKVSPDFIFGGGFEILNRNDGLPNLKLTYDMAFKDEIALEDVLRYTAIANDETQVTEAFSTDGMLMEYDLVVLEDDKSFFPPYHAVPVARREIIQNYPEIVDELEKLTNFITDDMMRNMNYQVDVHKRSAQDVAEEFLKTHQLIK